MEDKFAECESSRECKVQHDKVCKLEEELEELRKDYANMRQQRIDHHTNFIRARGQRDEALEEVIRLKAKVKELELEVMLYGKGSL